VAIWSLVWMAAGLVLLGLIDVVDEPLSIVSPLRVANLFVDQPLSTAMLAAGVAAIPANLGSTAATQAVQVYINRTVPVRNQGGVFGLQQVQQNALNLTSIFLLGAVATVTGPQYVFIAAPLVGGSIVMGLLGYTFRATTGKLGDFAQGIAFMAEDAPPEEVEDISKRPE